MVYAHFVIRRTICWAIQCHLSLEMISSGCYEKKLENGLVLDFGKHNIFQLSWFYIINIDPSWRPYRNHGTVISSSFLSCHTEIERFYLDDTKKYTDVMSSVIANISYRVWDKDRRFNLDSWPFFNLHCEYWNAWLKWQQI